MRWTSSSLLRWSLGVAVVVLGAGLGVAELASRSAPPAVPSVAAPPRSAGEVASAPSAVASASTAGRAVTPEITGVDGEDFDLHVFTFRVADIRFDVVDLGMGRDLEGALEKTHASLAINGGYFAPSTLPEGLVIAGGETLSPFSPTLGGGVLVVAAGRAALADATAFTPPAGADFAIQSRPRLVVNGAVNLRGDDGRKAERTALCVLNGGRQIEAIVAHGKGAARGGPTLMLLAEMLVSRGCEGALNLDGGPSTGAAWRDEARVETLPPHAAIRHAVTLRLEP